MASRKRKVKNLFSSSSLDSDSEENENVLLFGSLFNSPLKRAIDPSIPQVKRREGTEGRASVLSKKEKRELLRHSVDDLFRDLDQSSDCGNPPLTRSQSKSSMKKEERKERKEETKKEEKKEKEETVETETSLCSEEEISELISLSTLAENVHQALYKPSVIDELEIHSFIYPRLRFALTFGVDIPLNLAGRGFISLLPPESQDKADVVIRFCQQNPAKETYFALLCREKGVQIVWVVVKQSSKIDFPEKILGHTYNGKFEGKKKLLEKVGL